MSELTEKLRRWATHFATGLTVPYAEVMREAADVIEKYDVEEEIRAANYHVVEGIELNCVGRPRDGSEIIEVWFYGAEHPVTFTLGPRPESGDDWPRRCTVQVVDSRPLPEGTQKQVTWVAT